MTKCLWVYCPSPMFSKTCTLQNFYILSHLFSSWNNFTPLPHFLISLFFFFMKSPQPCFHKSYPQSKTFLNIQAVCRSAIFCSNAVLIRIPSSSLHFFSFFDVLPSTPTTTGTLMLLIFHMLLISLFSSWYLSIFPFSFSLTLMSTGIVISIHNFTHSYFLHQYLVFLP